MKKITPLEATFLVAILVILIGSYLLFCSKAPSSTAAQITFSQVSGQAAEKTEKETPKTGNIHISGSIAVGVEE